MNKECRLLKAKQAFEKAKLNAEGSHFDIAEISQTERDVLVEAVELYNVDLEIIAKVAKKFNLLYKIEGTAEKSEYLPELYNFKIIVYHR
jgi:hypothetical protein